MEIIGKQADRIKFIDFLLMYCGSVNRSNLMKRFKIASAGATRDIKVYRDFAPTNIYYDSNNKIYFAADSFKPKYDHSPIEALNFFSKQIFSETFQIKCETSTFNRSLRSDVLASLTRALHQGKIISLTYHNPFSGTKQRVFIPHCIVNDGLRWHVRGYCRFREKFIDLVVSRIENIKVVDGNITPHIEGIEADRQWNRYVDLEIVPHPTVDNKKAIEYEHQMVDGILKIEIRAAIAGYLLRSWNVDCSTDHSLSKYEHHLWLQNLPSLYGVNNLKIAPGYKLEE